MLAALMKSPTDYDPVDQPGRVGRAHQAGAGRHGRDRRDHRRPARQGAGGRAEGLEDRRRTRPRSTSSTGWTAQTCQAMGPAEARPGRRDHPRRCTTRRPPTTRPRPPSRASPTHDVEQAALVSLDGQGRVRAMIGGVDYAGQRLQPRGRRPPPGRLVLEAVRLPDRAGGRPHAGHAGGRRAGDHRRLVAAATSSRTTWGRSRCRTALAQSINTVAASLADEVGRPNVAGDRAAARHRDRRSTPIRPWRWAPRLVTPLEMARPTTPSPTAATACAPYGIERIRTGLARPDRSGSTRRRRRRPVIGNPPLGELDRCCARWSRPAPACTPRSPATTSPARPAPRRTSRTPGSAASPAALTTVVWMGRDDNHADARHHRRPRPGGVLEELHAGGAEAHRGDARSRSARRRPFLAPPTIQTAAPQGPPPAITTEPTQQPADSNAAPI